MKLPVLALLIAALAAAPTMASSCIDEPIEKLVAQSNIAFVATITSSNLSVPLDSLKNGEWYRIDYSFTVRQRLKGNPALVTGLFNEGLYHDPNAEVRISNSAETAVIPGYNVLVLADKKGDVELSFCGSTAPWSLNTRQLSAVDDPPL